VGVHGNGLHETPLRLKLMSGPCHRAHRPSGACHKLRPEQETPTPNPSPQGGGEPIAIAASGSSQTPRHWALASPDAGRARGPPAASFSVIARSGATKQSRLPLRRQPGLLPPTLSELRRTSRCARNDARSGVQLNTPTRHLDMPSRSRGVVRPSLAPSHRPLRNRGRREGRALAAPVARLRKKCRRQVPQVWPIARPSLRDV